MTKATSKLATLLLASALPSALPQSLLAGTAAEPQPYSYEATPKGEEFYRLKGMALV
jgi:hypothetical protein